MVKYVTSICPVREGTPIAYKSKEGISLIPVDAMAGALTENR